MIENRFSLEIAERRQLPQSAGFLMVPVAAGLPTLSATSPLQWLYQKMYEQAVEANQPKLSRDLFAVMN